MGRSLSKYIHVELREKDAIAQRGRSLISTIALLASASLLLLGFFTEVVYRPGKWFWIDSNGKKLN